VTFAQSGRLFRSNIYLNFSCFRSKPKLILKFLITENSITCPELWKSDLWATSPQARSAPHPTCPFDTCCGGNSLCQREWAVFTFQTHWAFSLFTHTEFDMLPTYLHPQPHKHAPRYPPLHSAAALSLDSHSNWFTAGANRICTSMPLPMTRKTRMLWPHQREVTCHWDSRQWFCFKTEIQEIQCCRVLL